MAFKSFSKLLVIPQKTQAFSIRRFSSQPQQPQQQQAQQGTANWRVVAGTVVERLPVVLTDDAPWEVEFSEFALKRREERAKLQDAAWKKRVEDELKLRQKRAKGTQKGKEAAEKKPDQEVKKKDESGDITFPLITPEDKANNRKTLYRKLTDSLYLIVKKPRDRHEWQFPQGGWEAADGNSLRKTAERELTEECGTSLKVYYLGNGPNHYLKYPYTPEEKKQLKFDGSQVFFFRALYVGGFPIINRKELNDYLWVTKDELKEYFSPELYKVAREMLHEHNEDKLLEARE